MNRDQAIAAGAARYAGRTCEKHPDLDGARYVCNWRCVGCALQATMKYLRSEYGSEVRCVYEASDKGRAMYQVAKRKYRSSTKGKATEAAYARTPGAKARAAARVVTPAMKERRSQLKRTPKNRAYMAMYRRRPEVVAAKRFYKAVREAHVSKNATPAWADKKAIASVYAAARRLTEATGVPHVVDHFYPLKGKTVCGLHVQHNLRVVTSEENLRKNNRVVED